MQRCQAGTPLRVVPGRGRVLAGETTRSERMEWRGPPCWPSRRIGAGGIAWSGALAVLVFGSNPTSLPVSMSAQLIGRAPPGKSVRSVIAAALAAPGQWPFPTLRHRSREPDRAKPQRELYASPPQCPRPVSSMGYRRGMAMAGQVARGARPPAMIPSGRNVGTAVTRARPLPALEAASDSGRE